MTRDVAASKTNMASECVGWLRARGLCASDGTVRVATVGRVKVEQRQMVLVEAEAEDGETFCALLQNAETVRLVNASGGGATSVSVLEPGDRILVHRQTGARHTGLKIEEQRWYER